ncbi:GNAT family N-acetyltransferase [Microbacterium sp. C7(2022)]|uniref:GNAT family N-acetyltransferase n=1 Tax=Microbacterium sp. C7(2022) TaxID=2992759 RepID=UPI00237AE579|nr:GNAT family N-acetyltransferase [Microbacterium sp. C7(2022)]MDE0545347.1 GNAT family N-acetyltransferase [Microbacterium sp. C7(2022)]
MTNLPSNERVTLSERVRAALGELRPLQHPEHSDVAQWRAPTPADIDAMLEVQVAADRVDHPSWTTPREDIADTFELAEFDHAHNSLIGFSSEGAPIVVVSAMRHPDTSEKVKVYLNGAVHPAWRRRGIGAAAARWQHARGLELLTADAETALPGELDMYAAEHDLGNVAIAEGLGLRTARWFSSMVRDMDIEIPELEVRDGIRFVQYSADRAEDARLARNDAFRDHWGSLPSQPERWAQFVGGAFLRPDLSTLALADDGRIVAFCLASVNEDDWETLGASNSYIDLIGVVRDHRGKGLAPRVIAQTLKAIKAAGLEKAVLDVDTDSPTGANTLYERLGFVATEREQALIREF